MPKFTLEYDTDGIALAPKLPFDLPMLPEEIKKMSIIEKQVTGKAEHHHHHHHSN